jgi:hypothetical protein
MFKMGVRVKSREILQQSSEEDNKKSKYTSLTVCSSFYLGKKNEERERQNLSHLSFKEKKQFSHSLDE